MPAAAKRDIIPLHTAPPQRTLGRAQPHVPSPESRIPHPASVLNRTLVLTDRDVEQLLPMSECIDIMANALTALARGEVVLPLRQVMRLPESQNAFALMPAILTGAGEDGGGAEVLGAKIITVFPGNDATPLESHIGVVLLFDGEHGRLLAIVDASSVTAIRTAAVSGLATRLLARPTAHDLAILGTGVQAMTHLAAMLAVRPVDRVRVWGRNRERAARFAARAAGRFGVSVTVTSTAQEAVTEADIICTVTASRTPVLEGAWIAPGTHINAVGSSIPSARELDTRAVQNARLYVDRRESAAAEAGDILVPRAEGAIGDSHIRGELGELLIGTAPGPEHDSDITLFKSLGLAIEDLAVARHLHEKAQQVDAGTWIAIGGLRHES